MHVALQQSQEGHAGQFSGLVAGQCAYATQRTRQENRVDATSQRAQDRRFVHVRDLFSPEVTGRSVRIGEITRP